MKNKTDDLFEHLEYYYGRKRRQSLKDTVKFLFYNIVPAYNFFYEETKI